LDPSLPLIYVTGGAQGASRINRMIGQALEALLEHGQIVHQCGDNPVTGDRSWLGERRSRLSAGLAQRYTILPFVGSELGDLYAATTLLVTRAGAGTLNECCQLGLPAIYIPLPGASRNEQLVNARLAERAGAALVLPQSTLTSATLVAAVRDLLGEPGRLKEMGERARTLAIADAADRLADLVLAVRDGYAP
jgi:UDP-N-acetylglucosamine--N-acetylmuramyl-(pentapeptide) pyrophosphoryl-undecaprenol N-acetylglucosamine transferase